MFENHDCVPRIPIKLHNLMLCYPFIDQFTSTSMSTISMPSIQIDEVLQDSKGLYLRLSKLNRRIN